jgi:hypothetical protein
MTDAQKARSFKWTLDWPLSGPRQPPVNDNAAARNASRKTILIALGTALVLALVWFGSALGF